MTALETFLQSHEKSEQFLNKALKDTNLSDEFLAAITNSPRENKANYIILKHLFPTQEKWYKWFSKYETVYYDYMHKQWNNAKKIEDVLKFIPNYSPWALKDKFGKIEIGSIPDEFGNKKEYAALLDKISNSTVIRKYQQFKALENNLPEFQKVFPEAKQFDWFNLGKRRTFLSKLLQKITGETIHIEHLSHKYAAQFLLNPFSCKMVFRITGNTNQEYILKISPTQTDLTNEFYKAKVTENQMIRADSPYSNALLEFYLKLNGCPNVTDILYYTDSHDAALYKVDKNLSPLKQKLLFWEINTKKLSDANALGIYLNDIAPDNFALTENSTLKIIDIGHASFANPLTQGIPGLTFTMGNLCGHDYLSHFGVMEIQNFETVR